MTVIAARALLIQGKDYQPGDVIDVPVRRALFNQGWVYDPDNPRRSRFARRRRLPLGMPGQGTVGSAIAEKIPETVAPPPSPIIKVEQPEPKPKAKAKAKPKQKTPDISGMTTREIKPMVGKLDDLSLLSKLLDSELEGKGRKTVLNLLEKRIEDLEGGE